MRQEVREVLVRSSAHAWILAGFRVGRARTNKEVGHVCLADGITISILPISRDHPDVKEPLGIVGLVIGGLQQDADCPSGLSFSSSPLGGRAEVPEHPNGIYGIDHIVAAAPFPSDCLKLAKEVEQATGFAIRLVQQQEDNKISRRQAFFKIGETCSLEIIDAPRRGGDGGDGTAFFWGMTFLTCDMTRTKEFFGSSGCSAVRKARQQKVAEGVTVPRQIATLRTRAIGLHGIPMAVISPRFVPPACVGQRAML